LGKLTTTAQAAGSYEILAHYHTKWCHIPESNNLQT